MKVNIHKLGFFLIFFSLAQAVSAQVWTLQQCLDSARVRNGSLQLARNNAAIGTEKRRETQANLLPKLSANADYKYFTDLPTQLMPLSTFNPMALEGQFKEAQFGVPHNLGVNVQLSMPLYNPQVAGAVRTTRRAEELAALQVQKSEEQVFYEVSNLYYNAQILQRQLGLLAGNIKNTERLLKNIQLLKSQLLARGSDVSKVELQVLQLQTQRESAASKYEQILNGLKFAIGQPIESVLEIDTTIALSSSADYAGVNPIEVQIARAQNRLAATELSNARRSRLPSLALFAQYGTTGFGYTTEPNDFLKFFPLGFGGVQFSLPLFNGTTTQKRINQKKLELQNNDTQLRLAAEQNRMLVRNATLQRAVAQKNIATTEAQIRQAQTIYDQTLLQQREGLASLTEVLLADNALREAQQNYLSAVVDLLKADLELRKQSGNIF